MTDYIHNFLNLYWLRPETAVWRAIDCLAMDGVVFKKPIIDIGCGDGLFSFARAGGELVPSYDPFIQANSSPDAFWANRDIYDHIADHNSTPIVSKPPAYRIDVGFDRTQSLLAKAAPLNFYDDLVCGDANKPLPFANECFLTVFSNILYWLENFEFALAELNRILAPAGQLIICVPSETFGLYSFYNKYYLKTGRPEFEWLTLLDRGRHSANIKVIKTKMEWEKHLTEAGFRVLSCTRYLSKTVVEAWDIGLRPISPYLIKMSNLLGPDDRAEIKREWIEGLEPLVRPLVTLDWPTDITDPPAFFLFVAEKR